MKAIAAKANKAEAKRLSRNKKQREWRVEQKRKSECMRHETKNEAKPCDQDGAEKHEGGTQHIEQERMRVTRYEQKRCGQDWAEECEEEAERIEQERPSALSKEETEIFDEVIQNFQTEWPTEHGDGGGEEDPEWIEGGDAMEFTIGRGDFNVLSYEKGIEGGEGEHCNLWSLLGADDERVPERDPWDIGLELESPDIQRWADEKGWAEVIKDAVSFDKG